VADTAPAELDNPPHACPCGCGADVPYRLFCCRPGWDRLPASLRREITSTKASFSARGRSMGEARQWFGRNPRGGSRG
jgi:hypothetical protein